MLKKKKNPTWQAKARMLLIHNPLNNDLLCKGVELAHEIQIAGWLVIPLPNAESTVLT